MSSWSWSAAPLPILTGFAPRHPSKCPSTSSVRSELPSTRYMIFSGPEVPHACSLSRSLIQNPNLAASSPNPRPSRAYMAKEPSLTQVYR